MIEMDCTCVQKHHSIPTEVIEVSEQTSPRRTTDG